jgi:hypothetical protein
VGERGRGRKREERVGGVSKYIFRSRKYRRYVGLD